MDGMKGLESNRIFTSVERGAHEGDGTGTGDRVIPWQYDAGLARGREGGREGGFSMMGNRMEFGLRAWEFQIRCRKTEPESRSGKAGEDNASDFHLWHLRSIT